MIGLTITGYSVPHFGEPLPELAELRIRNAPHKWVKVRSPAVLRFDGLGPVGVAEATETEG